MREKEELLLQTIQLMAENLAPYGFLPEARNRSLVRFSLNGKLKMEIIFQVPRQRFKQTLKVFPRVLIGSRALKKWWRDENLPAPATDIFFSTNLDEISPRFPAFDWIISGTSQNKSVAEMAAHIRTYAVPLLETLSDTKSAVALLCEHVWAISRGMKIDTFYPPLDFVLCYGSPGDAEKLFAKSLSHTPWARQVMLRYKELDSKKGRTTKQILSEGDMWINLAYVYGLRKK